MHGTQAETDRPGTLRPRRVRPATDSARTESNRFGPALGMAALIAQIFLLPILAAVIPAHSQTRTTSSSARTGRTAVTVYSRDLGFVLEQRTVEVDRDRDTVFVPVPERVDFSSVRLIPEGAELLRLSFRPEVAAGEATLERARGAQVRVVLRGDRVVEGSLVSYDGAWVVVRGGDGSAHLLSRGSIDDLQLLKGMAVRASTGANLEAVITGRRGAVPAQLAYLTGGLSWNAEHVLVRRGETGGTWSSHVTIENLTGRDFTDANVKLVAGDVNRDNPMPPPMPYMARATMMAQDAGMGAEKAQMNEASFADYHLYTLDETATLRDRETVRLGMLDTRDVKLRSRYLYRGGDPRGVRAQIRLVNDKSAGLGVPLPAGRVRIYEPDATGALQFVGESRIGHTAEAETLTVETGSAFDLVAERRETYTKKISNNEREYGVEISLRNRKKTDVEIVVEEPAGGDVEITSRSHPFTRADSNTLRFTVAVPAGKETIVKYVARQRW